MQNWANYAANLRDYSENVLDRARVDTPSDDKIDSWLLSIESELRQNSCLRRKNSVIALTLLPLFEQYPQGWNAVATFPNTTSRLSDYLLEWHSSVIPEDQSFVKRIRAKLTEI